jgi:hypothetical protein
LNKTNFVSLTGASGCYNISREAQSPLQNGFTGYDYQLVLDKPAWNGVFNDINTWVENMGSKILT